MLRRIQLAPPLATTSDVVVWLSLSLDHGLSHCHHFVETNRGCLPEHQSDQCFCGFYDVRVGPWLNILVHAAFSRFKLESQILSDYGYAFDESLGHWL